MRALLVFAGLVIVVGTSVARHVSRLEPTQAPAAMVSMPAAAPAASAASGGNVELMPNRQGHFHAQARVDGRYLDFLVDTGATTIALTARSAGQLGIHPAAHEFTARASTANGVVTAAPVRLSMVEVGGITVREVTALVFRDGVLGENLLGMSFLSRLRRYEYAHGRLVLEQ